MKRFDIAPFALHNHPPNELRFEEARDIEAVEVVFSKYAPHTVKLQYLRKVWPQTRFEYPGNLDQERPVNFGWSRMDDLFTPEWVNAAVDVMQPSVPTQSGQHTLCFTFQPLLNEMADFPGAQGYNVTFRRTVGIRLTGIEAPIHAMRVFTRSQPTRSILHVELDAGRHTDTDHLDVSGYNTIIRLVRHAPTTRPSTGSIHINLAGTRSFDLDIEHMQPAHRYSHDDGHLLFSMGQEAFTISLTDLEKQGPIWFAEAGIYITRADDPETFAQYHARHQGRQTVAQQVANRPEQSLAGAINGQPRPHPIPYCFGCKHARQKFWVEPNGDIQLTAWLVHRQLGRDTPRWKNSGDGRFLFGLDRWAVEARFNDPWPVMAYNQQFRRADIRVHQKCFAVPLKQSILEGEPAPDDTIVALVRFIFENTGDRPATAEFPIAYSHHAARTQNRRLELTHGERFQTDTLIPLCEHEELMVEGDRLLGDFEGLPVLRLVFKTDMQLIANSTGNPPAQANEAEKSGSATQSGVQFRKELQPGERCELFVSIPFVALESDTELEALRKLDFDRCYAEMAQYWRTESHKGAQIHTPDPHLNAVYTAHLPIVLMSDFAHPDGSGSVNTSVGACTYGNYTNESVMILEELEQRGLVDEVRRRLAMWVRYQGTVGLIGRFSDHDGVFFGADGLESGQSYNQHHGWALWYLARHYLHTGDRDWFTSVVESVVRGAEWILRQRQHTVGNLPHSRGWEKGFLPAGALEDVNDFFYWLSTNALTWRGLDSAAQALEQYGHPQATRYRREADAFRHDLIHGFETARQHSPLIRLRDGRWIPHYPSRLYCRGRDLGWIREVLEGSVYLLLSGLYDPLSQQGEWILDDFQDTRYMNPPFGYHIEDPQTQWFDCGGFSPQPNLLAGLLPYLDRDEIEVYLWMFFNAFAACYRAEVQALVEHPLPVLGFSNSAPFKTSDQSNAMKWLAYMFVYEKNGLLHLGRAIPRAWFAGEERFGAWRLSTPAGIISVEYHPQPALNRIEAEVEIALRNKPDRILLRFRHPQKKPIQAVSVSGRPHQAFQAEKGDVELPLTSGKMHVVVSY